jgi:hypothetical protein
MNMSLDIESLGFTKEELQERVIDRICKDLLQSIEYDEDGGEYPTSSQFKDAIDRRVKERIEENINAIAEKHVLPNVSNYIENLSLQETTKWGEKRGEPVTFLEYLAQRAEAYMQEKVSYDGKSKGEAGGYSWSGTQTRLTYLVEKHLHYSIETAMKNALAIANSAIATGIQETVKLKLAEVSQALKVNVKP